MVGMVRFQNVDGEVQNSCLLLGFIFIQKCVSSWPFWFTHTHPRATSLGFQLDLAGAHSSDTLRIF